MKLRNKKTGKVIEWFNNTDGIFPNSLAELNEEWEDVPEESKEHWFVSEFGKVYSLKNIPMDKERIGWLKLIGNYFETREEAEKAVERLRAWKRLRDNGFKFESMDCLHYTIYYYEGKSYETHEQCEQAKLDLELLFGGEE